MLFLMKRILVLIVILFSSGFLSAQKHDYNWVFGKGNGWQPAEEWGGEVIDFNTTPPQVKMDDRELNFNTYSTACSDSTGKLLFYTNGLKIHNYTHHLIENGDTINPGELWNSSSDMDGYIGYGLWALPMPGKQNFYMLFHNGAVFEEDSFFIRNSPLYYSVIDMNANGGLGKVLEKNKIIFESDGSLGWSAACKHGNGRDWWITSYKMQENAQYTWLLSPLGLTGPWIQEIGPAIPYPEGRAKCAFSPDGKTYVRNDSKNGPRIMDFDRCSGTFSNMRIIPYSGGTYSWGCSFSPESRFLYLDSPKAVHQVDLKASNLSASFDTIGLRPNGICPIEPWTRAAYMSQEGPDGKIYLPSHTGSSKCFHRIEKPSLPGMAAEMAYSILSVPRWYRLTVFSFPNYRLGEYEESPCDTLNFQTSEDQFFKTHYEPGKANSITKSPEYTIFETIQGSTDPEALRDKEENGDLEKVMYRLWMERNNPDAQMYPPNYIQKKPK